MHFFVMGLPRSLTSWLSVWLSYRNQSLCEHDISAKVDSLSLFDAIEWRSPPWQHYGVADSGLLRVWRAADIKWPDARWLLVQRSAAESYASLHRLLSERAPLAWTLTQHTYARQLVEAEAELTDAAEALAGIALTCTPAQVMADPERVWRHLLPNIEWDARHFSRLAEFNIQPKPETVVDALSAACCARTGLK